MQFIIRRLFIAALTVFAISALSFVIIQLPPGDYVNTYIERITASGTDVSAAQADYLRALYGLDQPMYVQYLRWMGRVVQGDFGTSFEWGKPVASVIGDRLTLTMVVSVAALILTWAVALPIGVYSALNKYKFGDYVFTFIGFIGLAVPNFLLALLLMYLGFKYFNMNIGGLFSPGRESEPWSLSKAWDLLVHLPVPALVLGLSSTAQMIRIMRANLLDELPKPYVISAMARGLPRRSVICFYPVRVALNPFASTIGYLFPYIVSGSIVVSLVLGLPTVGPLLLQSLLAQDMFLAGAIILLLGLMTVVGTLVSDLLLAWLDPRVRLERR